MSNSFRGPGDIAPVSIGLISLLPGTVWIGGCVANRAGREVRNIVETRGGSVRLRSRGRWTAGVYRLLRPVDLRRSPPTWWYRDGRRRVRWSAPGGCGAVDAVLLRTVDFTPGAPAATLTVPPGIGCLLIRRLDEGADAMPLAVEHATVPGGQGAQQVTK